MKIYAVKSYDYNALNVKPLIMLWFMGKDLLSIYGVVSHNYVQLLQVYLLFDGMRVGLVTCSGLVLCCRLVGSRGGCISIRDQRARVEKIREEGSTRQTN